MCVWDLGRAHNHCGLVTMWLIGFVWWVQKSDFELTAFPTPNAAPPKYALALFLHFKVWSSTNSLGILFSYVSPHCSSVPFYHHLKRDPYFLYPECCLLCSFHMIWALTFPLKLSLKATLILLLGEMLLSHKEWHHLLLWLIFTTHLISSVWQICPFLLRTKTFCISSLLSLEF